LEGLRIIDSLEVIAVADNSFATWTDPDRKDVQRYFKWVEDEEEDEDRPFLIAGGGLSLHIRATVNDEKSTILYDAAEASRNMENNVAALGMNLSEIDAIVMSHGHWDHFGGLSWTVESIGKKNLPVYVHPWMFLKKGFEVEKPEGKEIREINHVASIDDIEKAGGKVISTTEPILLADGMLLRTGEIPRVTTHEKGIKGHKVFIDGNWMDDTEVKEDVSLVANVRDKGLVVISGCSHAGIINIIREAQRLTGESRVHGVIGGLHLAGGVTRDTMQETVRNMKEIGLKLLVPCHCTGWRARHAMSAEMPNAYVEGSIGHKYIIGESDVS
jgi:7,8-dihydropterin-6-yl-methyl-4-(beta-D-ribofuranosyl)aminobenzene 5'-phosphate synthase